MGEAAPEGEAAAPDGVPAGLAVDVVPPLGGAAEVGGVVEPGAGAGAVLVATAVPAEVETAWPTQVVSVPLLTVKGADWATKPLLSRSVRPMDVPTATFTFHVRDVPF